MDVESQISENTEGYLVDAEEAAQILGVTQPRLSQLTTKGALSAQRRKVGTRHRLYYQRSELISYLRNAEQGYVVPKRQGAEAAFAPRIIEASQKSSEETDLVPLSLRSLRQETQTLKVYPKISALDFEYREQAETALLKLQSQFDALLAYVKTLELTLDKMQLSMLENRKDMYRLQNELKSRTSFAKDVWDQKIHQPIDKKENKVTYACSSRNLGSSPSFSRRRRN